MNRSVIALLISCWLTGATWLNAQELIVNGNFENTAGTFVPDVNGVMSLSSGSASIPGWTAINAELLWGNNANVFGPATPFGTQFVDLTGYHDSPPYGGVRQTLATPPGQNYRLAFALGAYQSNPLFSGPMTVSAVAGNVSNSFTLTATGAGNQWATFTLDFTADAITTTVSIAGTGTGGGAYLGLDNVSVRMIGPRLSIENAVPGQLAISWTPNTPGFVLEETAALSPANWTTSPSGGTNPVAVPATFPTKFYRLLKL